jgi:HEAT repeat protein
MQKILLLIISIISFCFVLVFLPLANALLISNNNVNTDYNKIDFGVSRTEFLKDPSGTNFFYLDSDSSLQSLDDSLISDWNAPTIISAQTPRIGDIYIETLYDSNNQAVIKNTWEYRPGLAMYDLQSELSLGPNKLNQLSKGGWILKEQHQMVEDKKYSFHYEYGKNEGGNWNLVVNIKDGEGSILETINLINNQEVNIEEIRDINSLINMVIYEPDSIIRDQIITQINNLLTEGIGVTQDKELAQNISDLIYHEEPEIRKGAAILLENDLRAIEALIIALGDENKEVRFTAADVLVAIGTSALEPLISVLKNSSNFRVRGMSAIALGKIGDTKAIEPLIDVLLEDEDPASDPHQFVKRAVASALEDIGEPAIGPLIEVLTDERFYIREYASIALAHIGEVAIEPLIQALGDGRFYTRKEVISHIADTLDLIGEPAITALVTSLDNLNPIIEEGAAFSLVRTGLKAMEMSLKSFGIAPPEKLTYPLLTNILIETLGSEDVFARKGAALILSKLGEPAVEPLIEALGNANSNIREGAKEILIKIGNPTFLHIMEHLFDSSDTVHQQDAIEIIQGIAEGTMGEFVPCTDLESIIEDIKSLEGVLLQDYLKEKVTTSQFKIIRAIALYHIKDKQFLVDHLFRIDTRSGKLYVKDEIYNNISKLEMAAILHTGIPASTYNYSTWWEKLAAKEEKIKYIKLVLKGDFTDERPYINPREWVCAQFATQLAMNFNGYNDTYFEGYDEDPNNDRQEFEEFGAGYVVPSPTGYGIPIYFATTYIHAFNAVFIGNGEIDDKIENWLFIEPYDDDFSPHVLEHVYVCIGAKLKPDNPSGPPDSKRIIDLDPEGYRYGYDI